jgi:hypothetical protein
VLVFLVVSFLQALPPISYMHSSSLSFMLPAYIDLHILLDLVILIILGKKYNL